MKKAFFSAAAVAATLAMAPAANAVVTLSPIDSDADGSFSQSFAGSGLADAFTESFTFTVGAGLMGSLSSSIITSAATAANDVDFSLVQITGGTLTSPLVLNVLTGEPIEARGQAGAMVGAGTYTFTATGTSLGTNGTFGGNVSFATAAAAVPEPATWGMMILGVGGIGFSMRRRNAKVSVKFA